MLGSGVVHASENGRERERNVFDRREAVESPSTGSAV